MANNDFNLVVTDVDDCINVGDSFLVGDPNLIQDLYVTKTKSINVIAQNIRSIGKNLIDFQAFLARTQLAYDLIILTECWLQRCSKVPILQHYNVFYTCNHINQNSGVVVYVRDTIANVSVFEPDISDADCLVVKINKDNTFVCLYRSPSFISTQKFIKSLNELLSNIKITSNIYLIGDINIDIGKDNIDTRSDEYLDLLATHGLLPSHTLPTRDDKCLDHSFVKSNNKVITVVCDSSVTDHRALHLCISLSKDYEFKKARNRTISKIDYERLSTRLQNMDWSNFFLTKDPNEATDIFIKTIKDLINKCTYSINIPNRKLNLQPWITPGLLRCMRFRDILHRRHKKTPDNKDLEITYKRYRNYCNRILHSLKNKYDSSELLENNKNIKKTWNVIKRVCNLNKSGSNNIESLLHLKSNSEESIKFINDYFATIGSKLADQSFKLTNISQEKLTQNFKTNNTTLNSLVFLEADESETRETINSLKNTRSTGWDGISSIFIKRYVDLLVTPITHLCNLCLQSGKFPRSLKESVVVPIFKSGRKDDIANYRPISLLPSLAKIIEKMINNRLVAFLEKNNVFSNNQFGFRENKSTIDAIDSLTLNIVNNLDNKLKCVGVFLDLKKAFDTVCIPLLICKLESCGIRGNPLNLLKDYLSDRTQKVKIGNLFSYKRNINFGIPQGSVLGPTLFLIYINDLCNIVIPNSKVVTFADDTAILFWDSTWENVQSTAEFGIRKVMNWLNNNVLTLNLEKTKYITFSIKNNTQSNKKIILKAHTCIDISKCKCHILQTTDSLKYLGITIDKNLNWKLHINDIKSRVRKLIYIFKRLRHIGDKKINRTVYLTLCQSIVTYGIAIWGGAAKSNLLELERTQRTILKVINFKCFYYPTTKLYNEFGVLNVRQLFIKIIVHRQHSRLTQLNISQRRTHEVYSVPVCKTSFAQRFSLFLAPFLYNRISKTVTLRNQTKHGCGKLLRDFLGKLDYYETEELLKICS